jgi:hypothetical protein
VLLSDEVVILDSGEKLGLYFELEAGDRFAVVLRAATYVDVSTSIGRRAPGDLRGGLHERDDGEWVGIWLTNLLYTNPIQHDLIVPGDGYYFIALRNNTDTTQEVLVVSAVRYPSIRIWADSPDV